MPIDPINQITLVPEFQVPGVDDTTAPAQGFGTMLRSSLDKLEGSLKDASEKSTALAAGTTNDLTGVVTSVERAQLELQLAVQVRNKVVEVYQDLFRMQI